ncbi:hypothetical protein [Agromyces sp. NPDC055661]
MAENEPSARVRKKWYVVGGGVLAAGFLTAAGAWAFNAIPGWWDQQFGVPFNANLAEYTDACERFVIDESLVTEVPVDAEGNIDEAWVSAHGGMQTDPRLLTLSIVGNEEPVIINAISIVDVEEYPEPDSPVIVGECPPMGGEAPDRTMVLNFADRSTRIVDEEGETIRMMVGAGAEPEVLDIQAPSTDDGIACFCSWRLEIAWTGANSGDGTLEVDLDGDPVVLVPTGDWEFYWFEDGELTHF